MSKTPAPEVPPAGDVPPEASQPTLPGPTTRALPDSDISTANMASYGAGKFLIEYLDIAFANLVFFYYEVEIGLSSLMVAMGFIVYALWNAVNDPLVGYLTDRSFKFTEKYGRRFPWIVIGGIPWILSYILLFTPPITDPTGGGQWIIFAWLIFTTCLFDTFASIMGVNFFALFPDKFRSESQRRRVAGVTTPIGVLGIAIGALVPPMLYDYGVLPSYVVQAFGIALIGLVLMALAIPGCREDQAMIQNYLAKSRETEQAPFFHTLKKALKQKNFLVFLVVYFLYRTLTVSLQSSINYAVLYILQLPEDFVTYLMAGFLVGALVSVPLWTKLAHKTDNNKKVILIGAVCLTVFTAPLIFIENVVGFFVCLILWGVGLGGFWTLLAPVLADVIDETVVETGVREEGMYTGFRAFFGRLALVVQAVTFWLAHELTGFVEGATTQSPEAIWGIHVHMGLVPMIAMALATFILWKYYDLTPDKVAAIKRQLDELGL